MTQLSAVRSRIRSALNDTQGGSSPRWSDAELTASMTSAQASIATYLIANGSRLFRAVSGVLTTDGTGLLNVSALNMLGEPVTVSLAIGLERYPLPQANVGGYRSTRPGVESLIVTYNATPAFPATESDHFVWGTSAGNVVLDNLLVWRAALECKVKEGSDERNQPLQDRADQAQMEALQQIPARIVSRNAGYGRPPPRSFGYVLGDTAATLQLVA